MLMPGWMEDEGSTILVNGQPLNGQLQQDFAGDVVMLDPFHPASGSQVASRPWCKRATGVGFLEPARARRRTYTLGTRSIPDRAHPC
jgi:hypothetical protein